MRTIWKSSLLVAGFLAAAAAHASGSPAKFHSVQFPEKLPVQLTLKATPIAPAAQVAAFVTYRKGQAKIEFYYRNMKPAILFGGDVTCYVVWAVTRGGRAENLGELLTRKMSGKLNFSTGQKNFALMVTAESYYLVGKPSDLVVFYNQPSNVPEAPSAPFRFDGLVEAPRHSMDAISHIKWDSDVPLDLLQARKAFELAERNDARTHATQIYAEAESALKNANRIATDPAARKRDLLDAARRAVALSNEALNVSLRRIESIERERLARERRQETAALEGRATEAEAAAEKAEQMAAQVRADAQQALLEKELLLSETEGLRNQKMAMEASLLEMRQEMIALETGSARLQGEKTALERESNRLMEEKAEMARTAERLRKEKAALAAEARRLKAEKDELTGRLKSALSLVADTEESARGLVINLPDILFDVNQASLKPEAQVVLAKLSGILLILPEQGALIEGHTDSTGSPTYNLSLSQRRAQSVLSFLQSQGLNPLRLKAVGYGMEKPIADNGTAEGRRRNRRVEILISEGEGKIASK